MLVAEAQWLQDKLSRISAPELSPLANIGSSTLNFRTVAQPWIEQRVFAPLAARDIRTIHIDTREGEGIDLRADIMTDGGFETVRALAPSALLVCNLLEHVDDPAAFADRCAALLPANGLLFVTVPYSYPHHRDPIDTMFRPDPEILARMFSRGDMIEGDILDSGESYADAVRRRPWLLLRHLSRFPFPFVDFSGWQHSMRKLYWLNHNYKVTVAIFRTRR